MDKKKYETISNKLTTKERADHMKLVDRIKGYPKNFEFTVRYCDVDTTAKLNSLEWVLQTAENLGYIKSIAIGHSLADLTGESGRFCSEETFKRI